MTRAARWAWVISLVIITGVCGVLAFMLSIGATTPRGFFERHYAWLFWVNIAVAVVLVLVIGVAAAAPVPAGAQRQVRQPAAAQAGRHLCPGRRGAGPLDLHGLLPVCEPQHRQLVRRAPGQRPAVRPGARRGHLRCHGRRTEPEGARCRREAARDQLLPAGAGPGARARPAQCAHRGPGGLQRPDPGRRGRRVRVPVA